MMGKKKGCVRIPGQYVMLQDVTRSAKIIIDSTQIFYYDSLSEFYTKCLLFIIIVIQS